MPRFLRHILLGLLLLAGVLASLIYSLTWRPEAKEVLALSCPTTAPVLTQGQALRLLVQPGGRQRPRHTAHPRRHGLQPG